MLKNRKYGSLYDREQFVIESAQHKNTHRMLSREEKISWMRLYRTENIGPIAFFHLIKKFKNAEEAIARLPEITEKRLKQKPLTIPSKEAMEKELASHESRGFHLIAYDDEIYPHALKKIQDPPPLISARGNTNLLSTSCVGIVGSRNASSAGKRMAEILAKGIGDRKMTVVSGLARGIDTAAHKESVNSGTIAVVAGGIDTIYPPENRELFHEISEKGLIISESPIGMPACGVLFPRRNRIISGLSWGIVVVEASTRSGSLITVKYALEQGRQVFAVPGHPLDSRSSGVNSIIKNGARIVEGPDDIMEEYTFSSRRMHFAEDNDVYSVIEKDDISSDDVTRAILREISTTPVDINHLGQSLKLSPGILQASIVELEISGNIERLPGGKVSLAQQ